MRYATHNAGLVGAVQIFQDQAALAHQRWILEILREVWVIFGDEQRVIAREGGDKRRIDGQVILRPVTGAAGSAITIEGFLEEQLAPFSHQRITRGCRVGRSTRKSVISVMSAKSVISPMSAVPLGVSG